MPRSAGQGPTGGGVDKVTDAPITEKPKVSPLYDPKIRGWVFQGLLLAALGWLTYNGVSNAVSNMAARGIPTGMGFWNNTAGFDVNQTLIPYSAAGSTYGQVHA